MIAPLWCVSLPFDPSSLRQPQMLDIQIWLHLFLFPLQQIGTSDRLTIKRYYFPFFSIDGTSYTTRKPCFDWGGYNHCHKALEVGENTNRHILNKKVLKGLFLKSNSGLKQTAPHWVILRLVMPSLVISDCQSDNCEEKNKVSGFQPRACDAWWGCQLNRPFLLINLSTMMRMCKGFSQTLTVALMEAWHKITT